MCVESQGHVEHTSRCRKGEAERNGLSAGPKASDRSRPMRKPKLGGSETCEKPEGMHASWRRQRILPRRKQRIWVLSQGRKQLGLPPDNCLRYQRFREWDTKSCLCMHSLLPTPHQERLPGPGPPLNPVLLGQPPMLGLLTFQ